MGAIYVMARFVGLSAHFRALNWSGRNGTIFPGGRGRISVVAAEAVEGAVGADDVRAATVDAVLVERPRVHEWLDENSERVFWA